MLKWSQQSPFQPAPLCCPWLAHVLNGIRYLQQRENSDQQGPFFCTWTWSKHHLSKNWGCCCFTPRSSEKAICSGKASGAHSLEWGSSLTGPIRSPPSSAFLLSCSLWVAALLRCQERKAGPRVSWYSRTQVAFSKGTLGLPAPCFRAGGTDCHGRARGSLLQVTLEAGGCAQFSCLGVASGILAAFSKPQFLVTFVSTFYSKKVQTYREVARIR